MTNIDPVQVKRMVLAIGRGDAKSSFEFHSSAEKAFWDTLVVEGQELAEQGIVTEYPADNGDWD